MNKWNKLKRYLDVVYGGSDLASSSFSKTQQQFCQKTGEHVVTIQYRFRRNNDTPIRQPTKSRKVANEGEKRRFELLKSMNDEIALRQDRR